MTSLPQIGHVTNIMGFIFTSTRNVTTKLDRLVDQHNLTWKVRMMQDLQLPILLDRDPVCTGLRLQVMISNSINTVTTKLGRIAD